LFIVTEPIVFISNQRIKPGRLDEYTQYYRQVVKMVEANKPGTLAHLAYASEDGTLATVIHVFPDAEAMALHMQGVGELAAQALEYMEIVSFEIYGRADALILEMMQQAAQSSIALSLRPQPLGGYLRLQAG
jgi:quinol monooxygenase YgiN